MPVLMDRLSIRDIIFSQSPLRDGEHRSSAARPGGGSRRVRNPHGRTAAAAMQVQ
jgi:hypothetical protein